MMRKGRINIIFPYIHTRPNTTTALEITMKCFFCSGITEHSSHSTSKYLQRRLLLETGAEKMFNALHVLFFPLFVFILQRLCLLLYSSLLKHSQQNLKSIIIKRHHNKKKFEYDYFLLFVLLLLLYSAMIPMLL